MLPQILNLTLLKQFAVSEFISLKTAGLISFSFADIFLKPCLYGKVLNGNCCGDSLQALILIDIHTLYLIGNSLDNDGELLDKSYIDPFIKNYGRIVIQDSTGEDMLIDTTKRRMHFLTPLEIFMRFPENDIGEENKRFVRELFG